MSKSLIMLRSLLEPVAAAVFLALWLNAESGRGDTGAVVMVALALAIALSRVLPYVSLGVLALTLVCQAIGIMPLPDSTDWPMYLAIPIVVAVLASLGRPRSRWIGLGAGGVFALAAVALMVYQNGGSSGWSSWTGQSDLIRNRFLAMEFLALGALSAACVVLAWGIGYAAGSSLRLYANQLVGVTEKLAVSQVELAVAQERNRIAQEMHDVLAHSLAVVVAQADGARYLRPTRPSAVDGALQTIADSARMALGDMRGVIDGILDGSELPQPRLDDLQGLVEGMASTGMSVSLREVGDAGELAAGQELALYRIVQEGLTNALRHRGRDASVTIVLDWRGPGVSLLLESTGGGVIERAEGGREGRGVIGMRERAHVAGGWLTVGIEDDGTHRVTAFVPYYTARAGQRQLAA